MMNYHEIIIISIVVCHQLLKAGRNFMSRVTQVNDGVYGCWILGLGVIVDEVKPANV